MIIGILLYKFYKYLALHNKFMLSRHFYQAFRLKRTKLILGNQLIN